jgi:hypothetical protein
VVGLQAQPAQLIERAGYSQRAWRLDIRSDLDAGLAAAQERIRSPGVVVTSNR